MNKPLGFIVLAMLIASPMAVVSIRNVSLERDTYKKECELISLEYEMKMAREMFLKASAVGTASDPDEIEAMRGQVEGLKNQVKTLTSTLKESQDNLSELDRRNEESGKLSNAVLESLKKYEGKWDRELNRIEGLAENMRSEETEEPSLQLSSRDTQKMELSMISPTIQLSGIDTVGSGVLISSRKEPGKSGFANYALTSYHVVRNILEEYEGNRKAKIVAITYDGDSPREEIAEMLKYDEELDLALLKLQTRRQFSRIAKVLPRKRWKDIKVFTPIYAVGCPLGNDPIPTMGEISSTRNPVNGVNYWMLNAPTYFGNSGGGIFVTKSLELIGIFSKIYTHGHSRPVVISHMGLATPIDAIWEWMDKVGYAHLLDPDSAEVASATEASK